MAVTRNHIFFGKKSNEKLMKPFDGMETKPIAFRTADGHLVNQHIIPSLIKAVLTVVDAEVVSGTGASLTGLAGQQHFAAGTATTEGDHEEIFVEWQAEGDTRIEIAAYNPNTGTIRCILWRKPDDVTRKYRFNSPQAEEVGSGVSIWICLLLHAKAIYPELAEKYENLKEFILYGTPIMPADVAEFSYEFFFRLTNEKIPANKELKLTLPDEKLPMPELRKLEIESKKACPSKGKNLYGLAYKVFDEDATSSSVPIDPVTIDFEKYKDMNWTKKELTREEEMLVPVLPKDNVMSKEVIDILEEMWQTKDNGPATRTMHALLEGDAGSGKSHTARVLAAIMHRPYLTYVCSSTDDKDSLLGSLLPYVEEEIEGADETQNNLLQVVKESSDEELIENACTVLGLPSLTDCFYDPEGTYEELTGVAKDDVTSQEVYAILTSKVMKMVKDNCEGAVKNVKNDTSTVKYKYIPSTIVQALRKGYFLELQEPTCVSNPSAFACLYDAFERDSIGVVNTVCGDVYRHPDFVLVGTTNRKYAGLKELNPALRSRFHIYKSMNMPPKEVLIQRLKKKTGITDGDLARKVVEVFLVASEKAVDISAGEATMRALYRFGDAVNRGKNASDAFETYLLYAITTSPEEAQEIRDIVEDSTLFK